jgi:hypothetical protein
MKKHGNPELYSIERVFLWCSRSLKIKIRQWWMSSKFILMTIVEVSKKGHKYLNMSFKKLETYFNCKYGIPWEIFFY